MTVSDYHNGSTSGDPLLDSLLKALDEQGIDLSSDEAGEAISESVRNAIELGAPDLRSALDASASAMHCDHEVLRRGFEKRLGKRWQEPLDLLHRHLVVALELGDEINAEVRGMGRAPGGHKAEALTRLHGRACQTAHEILCLLRGGFANGAFSRWRTLHEIAVVAVFLSERDGVMSERYLLHDIVESLRAARQYNYYCEALGFEPENPAHVDQLQEQRDALVERFGEDFGRVYGWAAETLGVRNPNFAQIERAASMDRYRPYVKLASHGIHAGPKGIFFNMSTGGSGGGVIAAGPSNVGLVDPIQFCVISLTQVTSTLVLLHPTIERLMAVRVLDDWSSEVGEIAHEVQGELESEGQFEGRPGLPTRLWHRARVVTCRLKRWMA